jgi:hypothetical protein
MNQNLTFFVSIKLKLDKKDGKKEPSLLMDTMAIGTSAKPHKAIQVWQFLVNICRFL